MNSSTKKAFRNWADSIDGVDSEELDDLQTNAPEIEVQRIVLQGFISTAEQIAIIEGAKGNSDISIEALAGTGKTTTLKMLADSKTHLKGTYVAFNKSIVDEAKSKFPSSVTCSTAHGLAYRAIGRDYASRLHSTQRLSSR
jgi:ABC-type dipeptide/oligopeptide/nickel transport system ATPase subunit